LAAVTLAAAAIASSSTAIADTIDATFGGGTLAGLTVDPPFTQGSFQNLSYRYESCGTEPAEETCTWKLQARLYSNPAYRCVPSTPESQLLLDSGKRSGNGVFESGPVSFTLEGCRGQILSVYYETEKTFNPDEEEGPWKPLSSGGGGTLLWIVIGGDASEANQWEPVPSAVPSKTPLTLAVSANCQSLKIGSTRYSFAFHRMGCRKATKLATTTNRTGAAPRGYACRAQGKGERCWRRHRPEKYVEWHLLSNAVRNPD
jgi:hypothetical protein